ncbi:MAG: septum site-determining protein MinC [Clostridiales bacterium]|jgi:septum site-determining protein MinC|nr:septum site-determining protein MinC [Clostridiales bacterium]
MAIKPIVTMKGQRDGIDIILDEKAKFDDIKESLRKKVSQGKKFFDGANVKVSFKGRKLDELSEKILIDIITEETNLDITFVHGEDFKKKKTPSLNLWGNSARITPPPMAELEKSAEKQAEVPVPVSSSATKPGYKESQTAYYYSGLRSGQRIKYNGSVVVMGDVNPGSEIVADGNVIVLGALKGMAHAGASGDDTCFISALNLQPTQLRIAGTISHVPAGAKNARSSAAYAYIKDGQVFIGPL